jgi:PAS domain S-box-containing protein
MSHDWSRTLPALLDTMEEAVFIHDASHTVVYVNKAFERIVGVEDPVGAKCHDLLGCPLKNSPATCIPVRHAADGLARRIDDMTIFPPSGRKIVNYSVTPLDDGGGMVVMEDVTDLRERQRILELERRLFQAGPVAVFLWKNAERWPVERVSENVEAIFGHPPEAFIANTVAYADLIHRDDLARVGEEVAKAVADRVERFEHRPYRVVRPDGTIRWLLAVTNLICDETGRVTHFHGCIIDITPYRETDAENERLSTAIEQAGDMVIITDTTGNTVYANPAFTRITGYASEELLGQNPRLLKSGQMDERHYAILWETLAAGESWSGRFVNRKKDGSFIEVAATISPVKNDAGEVINYVSVEQDITYQNALERAREYFTAVSSHELRTPLSQLKLAQTLIADPAISLDADPKRRSMVVAALARAYADFERIVSSTGLLTRLSIRSADPDYQELPPFATLIGAYEAARRRADDEGRQVVMSIDVSALPDSIRVLGDQDMLTAAFEEILSNAVKYTPDGGRVALIAEREGAEAVRVVITDEGIGIAAEQIASLFEPYFSPERPENHSTGRFKFQGGGLGLGLTLVRLVVDYHRGKVSVDSAGTGAGCRVTVRLPQPGVKL